MDKNTVIGFLLIAAVLIGYSWYARPSEEELQAQQEQIEKEEAAAKAAAAAKKKEAAKKSGFEERETGTDAEQQGRHGDKSCGERFQGQGGASRRDPLRGQGAKPGLQFGGQGDESFLAGLVFHPLRAD